MRARAWAVWGLIILASCTPEPTQAGQLPEITILPVAMQPIGELDFRVAGGRISGTLKVQPRMTTHPIRVALAWLDPDGPARPPLLEAEQQQLGTFDGSGLYAFDVALAPPSDVIVKPFARPCGNEGKAQAAVVVYVDVNDDGHLEIAREAVDHVLTSSDFPFEQLFRVPVTAGVLEYELKCSAGSFGELTSRLPLFDSRALHLATCPVYDRYLLYSESCGISPRPPVMSFYGNLYEDVARISLTTSSPTTVFIDGVPRGTGTPSVGFSVRDAALSIGQHHLRAETDGLPWEATFTFPDRTWIRGLHRVDVDEFELHFKEVTGAQRYDLFIDDWSPVSGTKSPVRFKYPGPGEFQLTISARFGDLFYGVHSSQKFTFD